MKEGLIIKMLSQWYPQNSKQLSKLLDSYLTGKSKANVNGIIVPHAGYDYSGKIAGRAFSLLKNQKNKTAVILSPSHYIPLQGILTHNKTSWNTSLKSIEIVKNKFSRADISQEHAIDNQIPFLQKLGFKKILPILIGEITIREAKEIALKISEISNYVLIVSTDLSHFLQYNRALERDKQTINSIINLNSERLLKTDNSACGIYPLLILIELCKLKNYKPELIDYKNSGDITGDKARVVGYASLYF